MKNFNEIEINAALLTEKLTNIEGIKLDGKSLMKEVAYKVCPSDLALDTFFDMIINRSKVIEAIIKDVTENFYNYTLLPDSEYSTIKISFITN